MFNLSFSKLEPIPIIYENIQNLSQVNGHSMSNNEILNTSPTIPEPVVSRVPVLSTKHPTLCLNMIIKNESNIITRLLTSVLPIIDCYCICDTGSTDNTIDIVTQFFKQHNIPGIIFSEPFKNFGYNRTLSLQKCIGMSDYVLLLDADMELIIGKHFDKSIISQYDVMYICQGNLYTKYYQNIRILKNNTNSIYHGVTHEYLLPCNTFTKMVTASTDILFINDIGDGGCKHNKYSRDIELLTHGIIDEPDNSRYYFYLANSYNDTSNYTDAITMYNKRISFGGWNQEVWYSYYRIGLCYYCLKEYEKSIYYLLEAYQINPLRVENIHIIIGIYMELTNHTHLVNMFLDIGLNIINKITPDVKNSYLFLENNIYTYDLYLYKLLHNSDKTFNPRPYLTKILNNCLDSSKISQALTSIWSYTDYLNPINSVVFDNINCFHSCIIPYTNQTLPPEIQHENIKYILNLITSQFDRVLLYINVDGRFVNLNVTPLDNPHKLYNMLIIDDTYISYKSKSVFIGKYDTAILGDSVRVIPAPLKINDKDTPNIYKEIISTVKIIQKPNYMYTHFKPNNIIYNWFPLIIGDIDGRIIHTQQTPNIFNYLTGGINTVLYNNTEYWTIAQIRFDDNIPLKIMHMFIVFDKNYNVIQYSNPVLLDNNINIVCHSLTMNYNEIIVTYLFQNKIKMSIYHVDIIKNNLNSVNPI